MIRVKFRFGTANRKEMSWMSETSALMDTLRQEGVSPDLLRAVEEYRTAHPLAEAVNEAARATNTLVIVKPHPAQDLAHIRALELSHLRFIDDGLFAAHGITSYEFLACTDALITDYSSVLFDYLLTGKPVGLTFEDIDAYARQPGFAIDPQPLRESAAMLDTPDDFRTFFAQLASGDDPLRAKRLQLTKLTNQYTDGHSAERVAAFLAERLREREHT